jgi:hypothetical protein
MWQVMQPYFSKAARPPPRGTMISGRSPVSVSADAGWGWSTHAPSPQSPTPSRTAVDLRKPFIHVHLDIGVLTRPLESAQDHPFRA